MKKIHVVLVLTFLVVAVHGALAAPAERIAVDDPLSSAVEAPALPQETLGQTSTPEGAELGENGGSGTEAIESFRLDGGTTSFTSICTLMCRTDYIDCQEIACYPGCPGQCWPCQDCTFAYQACLDNC